MAKLINMHRAFKKIFLKITSTKHPFAKNSFKNREHNSINMKKEPEKFFL